MVANTSWRLKRCSEQAEEGMSVYVSRLAHITFRQWGHWWIVGSDIQMFTVEAEWKILENSHVLWETTWLLGCWTKSYGVYSTYKKFTDNCSSDRIQAIPRFLNSYRSILYHICSKRWTSRWWVGIFDEKLYELYPGTACWYSHCRMKSLIYINGPLLIIYNLSCKRLPRRLYIRALVEQSSESFREKNLDTTEYSKRKSDVYSKPSYIEVRQTAQTAS